MSLTPSTMMELGTPAPDFHLPDVQSGHILSLADFSCKKALLIMFVCRHCPYVQHVKGELACLGKDYGPKEVGIAAISSNDSVKYPDDSPESLRQMAKEIGLNYPLLFDGTQQTAKAYRAACTPEFYLFDREFHLVYRGQLDDSRPGNGLPVTGKSLREALDALLEGRPSPKDQKPGVGCSIKWKPGNEPDYFR